MVCPWFICAGIDSALIYASFRSNTWSALPCCPGTTIAHLITNLCRRIDICSTICWLSPRSLRTSFILIDMQLPSENKFTYSHPKITVENSLCWTDTEINGPISSRKYVGWPNIVESISLINLSTMDQFAFPRALSTVVANDVSRLSTINLYGGFLTNFTSLVSCGVFGEVPAQPLDLPQISYLWTQLIFLILGVHSWKRCSILLLPLKFSAS